jgi:hypothetical protein
MKQIYVHHLSNVKDINKALTKFLLIYLITRPISTIHEQRKYRINEYRESENPKIQLV